MSTQRRSVLKNWFRKGLKPTQAQFADAFDSFFHKSEDLIPLNNVLGLTAALENKKTELQDYLNAKLSEAVDGLAERLNDIIEEMGVNLERDADTHDILPFDGFASPLVVPEDTIYEYEINSYSTFEYSVCLVTALTGVNFYLKVGDTYYRNWSIRKVFSPIGTGGITDPVVVPIGSVTEISNSDWYKGDICNKVFYNRSSKALYAYDYDTKTLQAVTVTQVAETSNGEIIYPSNPTKGSTVIAPDLGKMAVFDGHIWKDISGGSGGGTSETVPNSLAYSNGVLYLRRVIDGVATTVSQVTLPDGGGQTVVVQSTEDSPSIVRLNTDTSKLGKKVIPLGTSAANLFKNGVRQNDSDVYDQTTYSSDDGTYTVYHIKYEFDLNGSSVTVPEKSILKFEGGCLKNGTLVGNNTKVEVDGTYTIFDNMSFSGVFRDSNLYATNFGAIGNMVSVPKTLTFKNLVNLPIKERTRLVNGAEELNYDMAAGTESHDYTAFKKISQFISNSNNIHLTLNGEFYVARLNGTMTSYESYNGTRVYNANNLTIEGGSTTAAWWFYDCNNVSLFNTNYVGFHEIHDFPYIASMVTGTYTEEENGTTVTKNYSDLCEKYIDSTNNSRYGLADRIRFLSSTMLTSANIDSFVYPTGFHMSNCHVEMRNYGIDLGATNKDDASSAPYGVNAVKNCCVENCHFDHIKVQVITFHGVIDSNASNCTINYCSCPTDIGGGCLNITVENITATHCAIGIKEAIVSDGEVPLPCGNNIVSNYKLTIDDVYPYKRVSGEDYYILRTADSANSSGIYKFENCHFIVNRGEEKIGNKGLTSMIYPVRLEADTLLTNCQFEFSKAQCLFRGDSVQRSDFKSCKITIEDDTNITKLFENFGSLNISSSVIDYKDNGSAAKAPVFSNNVNSLNIENSDIYFRKGTSMGIALSDNTTFKQNKVFYNNSNGSYVFVLKSNVFIDSNIFDVTVKNGIFVINSTCENVKISKNAITTNAGVIRISSGAVDGIEIKDNIINYTNTDNVTSNTPSIINLGSSSNVVIEGNVFKGSVARKISDFVTYNTTIIGSLVDDKSRNTFANIPAASSVRQGFMFYDTTNNRILISDGTQWFQVANTPLQA